MNLPQPTETRPWGSYTILLDSDLCKVKSITVNAGQRLSLQLHHKREEHWTIVAGTGEVTLGENTLQVAPGSTIHIPTETQHRIANTGNEPLIFIEVQRGSYFGEDDIVRLQDDYQRA